MIQGDSSVTVVILEEGTVLAFRCSERGTEVGFSCLGPGDACGLEDALAYQPYSLSYEFASPGVAWRIQADDVRRLVRGSSVLADAVMRYLGNRCRLAAEHLEMLALQDLPDRVRGVLTRLACQAGAPVGPVALPLTQSHLAALVGASRQRTNAILADLHRRGIVDSRSKQILIRDLLALQAP